MPLAIFERFLAATAPTHDVAGSLAMRAIGAGLVVLLLVVTFGPATIAWLASHCREPIKSGSAQLDRLHAAKSATPTMGGLLVLAAMFAAVAAFADMHNRAVLMALFVAAGLALVGAIDDLVKLRSVGKGLRWKSKLAGQAVVAVVPAICCASGWCDLAPARNSAAAADYAAVLPTLGSIAWIMLTIVATSNAVNIADGLDGLAAGCLLLPTLAIAAVGYLTCDGAGRETTVVAAALLGGALGFLIFNRHPARVFMGNVGALPLGGLLGLLAVATHTELLLALAGGVFVAEAVSVIVQVASYRLTGRRVFRCAPLHHHFEFLGVAETTIVRRFWAASAACAVLGTAATLALSAPATSMPTAQVATRDTHVQTSHAPGGRASDAPMLKR